ncbi:MAG: OsmC family protein [Acidimicrobiales bacterium]
MPTRDAEARWTGDLPSGSGEVSLGSGAYTGAYSFSSRFEDGTGTNPEELIAAAHAGCFSMAFANELSKAGHVPNSVNTVAKVHLEKGEAGFAIPRIDLVTEADVPGIEDSEFQTIAAAAKTGCPVSKALQAVEITLDAKLTG